MKRLLSLIVSLLGINLYGLSLLSQSDTNQVLLRQILEKTADYCEKVKNMALFYVCKEQIVDKKYIYKIRSPRMLIPDDIFHHIQIGGELKLEAVKENTYIYDYQLVKKKGKLEEKRILLEENKKKKHEKNADLKLKYKGKYLVYGAVGFLSKDWQNYFDYELIGKDFVNGTPALIVKASPKPFNFKNRNYARIWIGENDFSILQIEWEPESIIGYKHVQFETDAGEFEKKVTWRVTYGQEKNGVRFPSRQYIIDAFINKKGKKYVQQEILFTFFDYKFFIVETEVRYRE